MNTLPKAFNLPAINEQLVTGVDVGGTKVHILDTVSTAIHRYSTNDYPSMDAVLENYFTKMGARPKALAVGMAGPRDDETGEVKMTNCNWPAFNPGDAEGIYGIPFSTANDMVATTAGVLHETGIDLLSLKSGTPTMTGTKLVIALSTGVGAAAAVWDSRSNRHVILAGEGGHIGFQPKDEEEMQYLSYLHKKYPHASAELALSGKHGIDNLVDHTLENREQSDIARAIDRARVDNRPVGSVLMEYATVGNGIDKEVARKILRHLGAMVGSVVRDLTVAYKATGGVYLTGSVALALGEYFASDTEFKDRFVRRGAVHDTWLEKVPIDLVTDPNVAAVGALALAKDM